ncbi:hypothetical protein HYV64_00970 [Candidatus Shapirobacteria bacterium]|nr:hypothetical protein [Candidatus Shapirobacteria bacterium]
MDKYRTPILALSLTVLTLAVVSTFLTLNQRGVLGDTTSNEVDLPTQMGFSSMESSLKQGEASFSFDYDGVGTMFKVNLSLLPSMDNAYPVFGLGKDSPVVVSDPSKWNEYVCDKVYYWTVEDDQGVVSEVQQAYADCIDRKVTDGRIDNTPPYYPPNLLFPLNGAVILNPNYFSFDWTDVLDGPGRPGYLFQVSENSSFEPRVLDQYLYAATPSLYRPPTDSLVKGKTYYWRVCGTESYSVCSPTGTTYADDWSPVWSFRVANPPTAPVLTNPSTGASTTSVKPLLKWRASTPRPAVYQLQVAKNPGMTQMAYQKANIAGSATQFTVPSGLVIKTKYYWRMRAKSSTGDWGPWSKKRWFMTP